MESMTKKLPVHTIKVSHIAPAVPPLDKEKTPVVRENSQVNPRTTTKPTMLKNRKRRWSLSTTEVLL